MDEAEVEKMIQNLEDLYKKVPEEHKTLVMEIVGLELELEEVSNV